MRPKSLTAFKNRLQIQSIKNLYTQLRQSGGGWTSFSSPLIPPQNLLGGEGGALLATHAVVAEPVGPARLARQRTVPRRTMLEMSVGKEEKSGGAL